MTRFRIIATLILLIVIAVVYAIKEGTSDNQTQPSSDGITIR